MNHIHQERIMRQPATNEPGGHRGHHRWMMIACCIPMLVIAVALVLSGAVSVSYLIFAVGCVLMMAVMMGGMGHGTGKH